MASETDTRSRGEDTDGAPQVSRTILIVGGGIAGMTAAVEAAEAGYESIIIEKEPYLGGRVAQLYRYFPKLCPPYCGLEINFRRIKDNPKIRFFTMAQVETISGMPGNFEARILIRPRYVNDRCTACNACVAVCPAERSDAFNFGVGKTKAIYLPHDMAFPMKYVIDGAACALSECARCVEVCEYDAIDLKMEPRRLVLRAGAIIVASGWKPYDANRIDNLGFGRYADVITNVMMERMAAPNGPTRGRIVRPSNGAPVESAAFIQCAGSRDHNHLGYCSTVCCLASLKQAAYLRERNPNARAHIFYIDLRTPGTYEFFAKRVLSDPCVTVQKGKVAKVTQDPQSGRLVVEAEDILSARKMNLQVDLVVLAVGMESSLSERGDGKAFRPSFASVYPERASSFLQAGPFSVDRDWFAAAEIQDGIFAAGCARGPFDVAASVQDATAAAAMAIEALARMAES
jgi:heterodisulfide reductase subunit A-like polyferredoxin